MSPAQLTGKRALVLEDDGLIAADTGSDLAEAGAVVDAVATCADGMALLDRGGFDFAVLDIKLSGETSYALASELQQRGVPFLFISGYDQARADFADVILLQKPFSRDALLDAVARLIGANEAMNESELITQDEAGTPLRWRTPAGVMHAVERKRGQGDPRLFASRTRCGRDIDPLETWVGRDTLSCDKCFAIELEDRLSHSQGHASHTHAHEP